MAFHGNVPFDAEGTQGNDEVNNMTMISGYEDQGVMREEELTSSLWDGDFKDSTRFWVQYICVPLVVIIGLLGNIVTVFILTRKQMRTSSNIYLTALAISDLTYLIFSFSMSWKHYDYMKGVWLYWNYIPFGLWMTDASSSASVWLTLSFTIERYIAVCHPMVGKACCTEKRAKYVAWFVSILCFLLTASTPFEWRAELAETKSPLANEQGDYESSPNNTVYMLRNTDLGTSPIYRLFYNWFTILFFVLFPLFILAILNCFLINAVRKSRVLRETMTTSHLYYQRRLQIMRQEDRITTTLISVVIVFLLCQLPTAAVLIYTSISNPAKSESREENILLGLGNICNLLVAINAACNFFLYTALSDKYRRVFINVLCFNYWKFSTQRQTRRRRLAVVYATPVILPRRSCNQSGLSRSRNEPKLVVVNAFVSFRNSGCGDNVNLSGSNQLTTAANDATGDGNMKRGLKVVTLKKTATSLDEKWFCESDNKLVLKRKEFQSV